MPTMHSTPAPNKDYLIYFVHLGGRTTLAGFMWAIRGVFYDRLQDIACMSQCLNGDKIYFFVELVSKEVMDIFLLPLGNSAVKGDMGAIFIPVDPHKGTDVVTLTGVPSSIHDLSILDILKPYGDPTVVVWGSHWVGQDMYNGKRYVTFEHGIEEDIPPKMDIHGATVLVKYSSQPKACFACGSLTHMYSKCKQKHPVCTDRQEYDQSYLGSHQNIQSRRFLTSGRGNSNLFEFESEDVGPVEEAIGDHKNRDIGAYSVLVDASTSMDMIEINSFDHVDVATNTEPNSSRSVDASTSMEHMSADTGVQCSMKNKKQKKETRDVGSWAKVRPSKCHAQSTMTYQCTVVDKGTQVPRKTLGEKSQGIQCKPLSDHVVTQTEDLVCKCVTTQTAVSKLGQFTQCTQTVDDPLKDVVADLRNSNRVSQRTLHRSKHKFKETSMTQLLSTALKDKKGIKFEHFKAEEERETQFKRQ
jgi:hypothetical protein